MRDYEKMVKSLRICADSADPISECCFSDCCEHDEPIDPLCMGQLIHMAADAIEELLLENDALGGSLCECDDLLKKLEHPKWISPEKAPNTDSGVVGFFNGGAFHQLYWYDFVTTLPDGSIVPENNERDIDNIRCIAVFKLPEPPKEDENGR